jgi:hypothetical protein
MGLDIIVPFVGDPDPTLPYASEIDNRINPGSLLLIEPTHSYLPWAAGVPGDGATLKNVAWESAQQLLGAGDAGTLAPTWAYAAQDLTKLTFERTTKGALHGISSAAARGGKVAHIQFPAPIVNYLSGAPQLAKSYAVFVWFYVTRAAAGTVNLRDSYVGNNASAAGNNLYNFQHGNFVGAGRSSVSIPAGWTGAPNANPALNAGTLSFGNTPPYAAIDLANGRSKILYSFHLIELAAAGITFAEADAIDAAAYAQAFGEGGRFYDDEWTDPVTVIAT